MAPRGFVASVLFRDDAVSESRSEKPSQARMTQIDLHAMDGGEEAAGWERRIASEGDVGEDWAVFTRHIAHGRGLEIEAVDGPAAALMD
jgi:hypothetical protein